MCAHYQGAQRCKAFSAGIPPALWSGEHLHREPYPGDSGILFQAKVLAPLFLEDISPASADAKRPNQAA
jgi:hypothetical protein